MKCMLFVLFLFTLLLSPFTLPSARADMALVPQTGQTTKYVTGDDGDTQMGVPWPSPRFTDNANGTITDNLTGLVWLKNANCADTVGGIAGGAMTWANAITRSNNLATGKCGLTDGSKAGDWRMPNRKELKSLINREKTNQALWLNGLGFLNVQASNYWSSSTDAGYAPSAWIVYMYDGSVNGNGKSVISYVWPVRSRQ